MEDEISYKVSYRSVKNPRIEIRTNNTLLILPRGMKPDLIISKHKEWIIKKHKHLNELINESLKIELYNRTETDLIDLIYSMIENISEELNVKVNRVRFRTMKTKWASISITGNVNFNLLMRYIPNYLVFYIVYHELCHLIINRHNRAFYNLISKKYCNYKKNRKELTQYWLLISRTNFSKVQKS